MKLAYLIHLHTNLDWPRDHYSLSEFSVPSIWCEQQHQHESPRIMIFQLSFINNCPCNFPLPRSSSTTTHCLRCPKVHWAGRTHDSTVSQHQSSILQARSRKSYGLTLLQHKIAEPQTQLTRPHVPGPGTTFGTYSSGLMVWRYAIPSWIWPYRASSQSQPGWQLMDHPSWCSYASWVQQYSGRPSWSGASTWGWFE